MAISGVADLAGRVLAGRYRLLAPIGAGASGRVYLADDVRLRRRVAVKVLHAALAEDAGFLRRFRTEAQLAASLHHPNVMTVYDWGEDGVPFMVLELLEGGSLRGMLDHDRLLSASQAAHVGREVTAALEYAHTRGLVHRDIKPANLLFDEHGIVRVADFGLARALAEASWTEPAGTGLGTARYAAPEQATGARLDGRGDLYALALVLIEAVTGRVPHVSDTPIGTLAARQQRPLTAPPELGPLGAVIERAGRPEPAERYPDAITMGSALADAEAALPPPGPLSLAGLGEVVDDPFPTQLPRSSASPVFDQDAEISVVDEPLVIHGPRRSERRLTGAIVALIAVLALLAAGFALTRTAGATAAVPNTVGATQTGATAIAQKVGLAVTVEERNADDPLGVVIAQHPPAGGWVRSGGTIRLVVSRGPPLVPVPDLAKRPPAEAEGALRQLGFVVTIDGRFDENVLKGVTLGTEPAGRAPRDSVIHLIVSNGPAPVKVPDVSGKTFEDAAAVLTAARLGATRGEDFSDTVAPGLIIRTDPPAAQQAPRDSVVTVVVSKGPELVPVPNVVGGAVEVASQQLRALGLVPDVRNYSPGARVRAQDPTGGKLRKGQSVTLFL